MDLAAGYLSGLASSVGLLQSHQTHSLRGKQHLGLHREAAEALDVLRLACRSGNEHLFQK
jgi:hypothetical protein